MKETKECIRVIMKTVFLGKGIVLGNLFTYEMFYIINRK